MPVQYNSTATASSIKCKKTKFAEMHNPALCMVYMHKNNMNLPRCNRIKKNCNGNCVQKKMHNKLLVTARNKFCKVIAFVIS